MASLLSQLFCLVCALEAPNLSLSLTPQPAEILQRSSVQVAARSSIGGQQSNFVMYIS